MPLMYAAPTSLRTRKLLRRHLMSLRQWIHRIDTYLSLSLSLFLPPPSRHLDHVSSLILGSAGLPPPAFERRPPSSSYPARTVYGSLDCLKNLTTAFHGHVWPQISGFARDEEAELGSSLIGSNGCRSDPMILKFQPYVPAAMHLCDYAAVCKRSA